MVGAVYLVCDAVHVSTNTASVQPVEEQLWYGLREVLLPAGS